MGLKDEAQALAGAQEPKMMRVGDPTDGRGKLWERRSAQLAKDRGTTARDAINPSILFVAAPQEVMDNVEFCWMSDIFLARRPLCPGFEWDLYKPVTPDVAKELRVRTNTQDHTPDGLIRAGHDALLYWAPKKEVLEMRKRMRGPSVQERMQAQRKEYEGKVRGEYGIQGLIGGMAQPTTPEETLKLGMKEVQSTD